MEIARLSWLNICMGEESLPQPNLENTQIWDKLRDGEIDGNSLSQEQYQELRTNFPRLPEDQSQITFLEEFDYTTRSENKSDLRQRANIDNWERTEKTPYILINDETSHLGRGGMAEVWEGLNLKTGRRVAIKKLIYRQDFDPETAKQMTHLEAITAAQMPSSANIVDVEQIVVNQDSIYIISQYMDPETNPPLVDFVTSDSLKNGIVDADHKAFIGHNIHGVCKALDMAHKKGVIHRDVKPSNIFTGYEAKLGDFGLVLRQDIPDPINRALGTIRYVAPEILDDSDIASVESDIYALGITCYLLLMKSPPDKLKQSTQEEFEQAIKIRVKQGGIADEEYQLLKQAYGESMARVLKKATHKNKNKRYHNVMDFWDEFSNTLEASPDIIDLHQINPRLDKMAVIQSMEDTYVEDKVDKTEIEDASDQSQFNILKNLSRFLRNRKR